MSASFNPPGEAATAIGYPPVYYPGTPSPVEARRIRIGLGEEAPNINLTLVSGRYAVVSGTVLNSLNAPASASVQLVTAGPVVGMPVAPARAASNGTFTLRSIPPGEYRVHVNDVRPTNGYPEFASTSVSVSGDDVTGLTVTTAPGAGQRAAASYSRMARRRMRVCSFAASAPSPARRRFRTRQSA